MFNYPMFVKDKLMSMIEEMADKPEPFVREPGKDFTRNRKLSFPTMIKLLLSIGGGSIDRELLEYFEYNRDVATSSAFVQQRSKLLPQAFQHLLYKFTKAFENHKTFEGYRLIAFDGSDLHIPCNSKDTDSYYKPSSNTKGYNLLHLNAMYDLCNKLYLDVRLQASRKQHEYKALIEMVDESQLEGDVLVICDRGLESYNVFAHIAEKGWKYLIRVKDINSNGILSSLELPSSDQFDEDFHRILTRKQTKTVKDHPDLFKFMPNNSSFDYFTKSLFYPMSFRVVRIQVKEGSFQSFITNLPSSQFSADDFKALYHRRWGIETSFRELKYALGLTSFHSKKVAHIAQEVFARLVMYNFCEIITLHVVIKQGSGKYLYQVNFTRAMQVCRFFFKCFEHPPDVEALIQKYILPIRNNRIYPRKVKFRSSVSFNYRVA